MTSLLYQNFDATAALVATTLAAAAAAPVPRTGRVATRDVTVADHLVPAGSEVILEIGSAGFPFGAGPHQCPGQVFAEAIVASIVSAITDAGYRADTAGVTMDADGRPTYVPIHPS